MRKEVERGQAFYTNCSISTWNMRSCKQMIFLMLINNQLYKWQEGLCRNDKKNFRKKKDQHRKIRSLDAAIIKWSLVVAFKESWAPKNWCFWTVVLEKTLESPLDCKEIQPVHPKGDQSWVFIGRTDVEAETPILWPSDAKSWLIWKDPNAGKDLNTPAFSPEGRS